jgi:hypothetical protein
MNIIWRDGLDNYKQYTHNINVDTNIHNFNIEILDIPYTEYSSLSDYTVSVLGNKGTKFVDILYSGGLDSELALVLCLQNKIPVRAITMRLIVKGYAINTHDLYYSEKFCRANNVQHIIIDLDVEHFFENGIHINYLSPYFITEPHVATHFWLFEQCEGFPVLGGDYSWPWVHKPLLSPHRHNYSYYDKFLRDNNMEGIGNFLNYSLASNLICIKTHLEVFKKNQLETDPKNIPIFKQSFWGTLNLPLPERRARSYGWDNSSVFNLSRYKVSLIKEFGVTHSTITWGNHITNIIGGDRNTNGKYN